MRRVSVLTHRKSTRLDHKSCLLELSGKWNVNAIPGYAPVEVLLFDINTLDTGACLCEGREIKILSRRSRKHFLFMPWHFATLCYPTVYTNAAAAPGTFYRAEEPISPSHSWVTLPFRIWGEPFGQSVSFTFVIKRLSERLRVITMQPARDTPLSVCEYISPLASNVSNGRLKGYPECFLGKWRKSFDYYHDSAHVCSTFNSPDKRN